MYVVKTYMSERAVPRGKPGLGFSAIITFACCSFPLGFNKKIHNHTRQSAATAADKIRARSFYNFFEGCHRFWFFGWVAGRQRGRAQRYRQWRTCTRR